MDNSEEAKGSVRYLSALPLVLDLVDERLWIEGAPVHVSGKAFLLLRALMCGSQQLRTKDQLIEEVWDGKDF